MDSKGGIGLGLLIIIALLIWWFFIRVDYTDVWFRGSDTVRVIYCGDADSPSCSTGKNYILSVEHLEKAKAANGGNPIHLFEISFPNGGHLEVEGTCDKAPEGMYSFDRFCRTITTNGSNKMYIIAPK